jgi:hypothetical protein
MSKKSKFVQAMLGSFWESHGMDANGKLTVINESLAKKTDDIFKKIVLEKSVAKYETYESVGDDLSSLADEISFQELNADGSSMQMDLMPSHDEPQGDDQQDSMDQMGGGIGGMDQMGAPQGGDQSLDLPEDVEMFDFNSIFEDDEEDEEGDDEGDEEESDLKEFDDHNDFQDLDPDMDPDHQEGDEGDEGDEFGGHDEFGGDTDEVNSDPSMMGHDEDGQMGGSDEDHVDITNGVGDEDKDGEFDFDFDLPGEKMPGEGEGDEDQMSDFEGDDKQIPMEGKKPKKGSSKMMNIVPKNRKTADAKLRY